jgi:hypothetical protein
MELMPTTRHMRESSDGSAKYFPSRQVTHRISGSFRTSDRRTDQGKEHDIRRHVLLRTRNRKGVVESGVRVLSWTDTYGDVETAADGPGTGLSGGRRRTIKRQDRVDIAPHAKLYMFHRHHRYAQDYAKANKTAMHTQLSETDRKKGFISRFNRTPGDYLASIDASMIKNLLAHCVHSTDAELSRFMHTYRYRPQPHSICKLQADRPIANQTAGNPLGARNRRRKQ